MKKPHRTTVYGYRNRSAPTTTNQSLKTFSSHKGPTSKRLGHVTNEYAPLKSPSRALHSTHFVYYHGIPITDNQQFRLVISWYTKSIGWELSSYLSITQSLSKLKVPKGCFALSYLHLGNSVEQGWWHLCWAHIFGADSPDTREQKSLIQAFP